MNRHVRRRLAVVAVAVSFASVSIACTSHEAVDPTPSSSERVQDDSTPDTSGVPFATYSPEPGREAATASIEGTLSIMDGCLVLEGPEDRLGLVLPTSVVWDQDKQAVIYGGRAYASGESVRWGGAYTTSTDGFTVPTTCRGLVAEWAVVNPS